MNTVTIEGFDRYGTAMIVTLYHLTKLMDAGLVEGPARLSSQGIERAKKAICDGFQFNPGERKEMLSELLGVCRQGFFETRQ